MISAGTAGHAFELRCEVREKLVDFLQKYHPEALPALAATFQWWWRSGTSSQTTGHWPGQSHPAASTGRPIANQPRIAFPQIPGYPA